MYENLEAGAPKKLRHESTSQKNHLFASNSSNSAVSNKTCKKIIGNSMMINRTIYEMLKKMKAQSISLNHLFPMHPFSTPMFSGGRERVHWEQMG